MISDLVIPTPLTNICYFDGKDNNFQFRVILLIIFISMIDVNMLVGIIKLCCCNESKARR